MKLELTVIGSRQKNAGRPHYETPKFEDYTAAEVTAEGDANLIAAHLRAVADAIAPPQNAKSFTGPGGFLQ